jgi:L-rhamnose mutarotase
MQRAAWVFSLKKGKEQAYLDAHTRVWPELIDAARAAGLKNQSLYIQGSTVFAYTEAEDMDTAMKKLESLDVTRRWNEAMSDLMEDVNGVEIAEIFHFE